MHLKVSEFHPELQHQIPALRRRTKLMRIPGVMRLVDWLRRREEGTDVAELSCDTAFITSTLDGYEIRARIYKPKSIDTPLPCFVYFHGGGYVMGLPEGSAEIIKQFIATRPCIVVAPDYRKAKTRPYPAGFQDCYDALIWARDHAEDLGCRPDKMIIGGHSAGGGLTAAVALKARDTGQVDVAFQMPFFPMIDETQPDDPARNIDPPVWDTALNRIGWAAYLRDIRRGHVELDAYAAPARADSYAGLPPTITYVGSKDPFFWETQTYVARLRAEGVEVSDCVFEGCYHAFEFLGDSGAIGAEARRFTFDTYAAFYDRHTGS